MSEKKAGLRLMTRREELSRDDWLILIQSRASAIKPHLKSFTLEEFGKINILNDYHVYVHSINDDNPEWTVDPGLSAETQGIYSQLSPWKYQTLFQGQPVFQKLVLGLTRSGEWILATIKFIKTDEPHLPARPKNTEYEKAIHVTMIGTTLENIIKELGFDPEPIWNELGHQIEGWERKRQELYKKAHSLAKLVRTEQSVLRAMRENQKAAKATNQKN